MWVVLLPVSREEAHAKVTRLCFFAALEPVCGEMVRRRVTQICLDAQGTQGYLWRHV